MKRFTTDEFINKSNTIHNFKYNYSKSDYKNSRTKVEIICQNHESFWQTPNAHWRGQGCPTCGDKIISKKMLLNTKKFIVKKLTSNTEKFIEQADLVHNFKYNYSKVVYERNNKKVEIICKNHGSFWQTPNAHILQNQGCPVCGIEKRTELLRSNTEEFIEKTNTVHNLRYNYSKVNYKNARTKVCIICLDHGEFWQTPDKHLRGDKCPKCTYRISKPEIQFLDYLEIPDTKEHRQLKILRKEVDGLKDNVIYEFLGDYWHGNPEKYEYSKYNPTCKKTFGELYEITIKRFQKLKKCGYKIKYIWELDWKKFKSGIDLTPKISEF